MDEKSYAYVVQLAAQIEVLHVALAGLTAQVISTVPPVERDAVIRTIQSAAGDLPPRFDAPTPDATKFSEDVAAAAPRYAQIFADTVRKALM